MPPITAVPIAMRLLAPAPVEIASGSTPKMKAKLVIRIGRRRILRRLQRGVDHARALASRPVRRTRSSGSRSSPPAPSSSAARSGDRRRCSARAASRTTIAPTRPERDDEQHRDRDRPAFVQRGEAQEDDEQRQAVEERRLARGQPLLIATGPPRRPMVPGICAGELGHPVHRLARARARSRPGPGIRRTAMPLKRDSVVGACRPAGSSRRRRRAPSARSIRARTIALRSSGCGAIGRVALDVDALHAAAIDEVVDVAAAPGGRQRRVDVGLASGRARPASAGSTSILQRRRCRAARSGGPTAASDRRCAAASSLSRAAGTASRGQAAGVLQLHREAVRLAEAADRRRAPARRPARRACRGTRADARSVIASALFSLPLRSAQSSSVMKPWPVFWPARAAAAAAGDGEHDAGCSCLSFCRK